MTWNDQTDYETSALDDRDMWERSGDVITRPPAGDPWPTPTEHRRAIAEAELHAAEQALRAARQAWYETLPELTDGLRCSKCGNGDDWRDLHVHEEGYTRWVGCQIDGEKLIAHTDGWDDMSDEGEFEYVMCDGCGQAHVMPDGLEFQ